MNTVWVITTYDEGDYDCYECNDFVAVKATALEALAFLYDGQELKVKAPITFVLYPDAGLVTKYATHERMRWNPTTMRNAPTGETYESELQTWRIQEVEL